MTEPQTIYWKPTEPQAQMIYSNAKFRIFLGGIGSGKTVMGCMNIVLQAVNQPGSLGVVVTTTYPMMRDVVWREMWRWIPENATKKLDESKHELSFRNGSTILFRSADNHRQIDRLRGLSIAWFWVDEITLMPKLILDILIGRLRQPGMKYSGLLTGTPKMNWVYDTFIDPKTHTKSDEYFILKEIPTFSNIYLPPEYVKTLKEQYTGQFYEQEVLGKFVSFEGLIYDLKAPSIIELPKYKYIKILYGIDFGFKNPSAIIIIGEYAEKYYVLDEFYQRKVTDDELVDIIKQKQDIWGVGKVYCDPSAPASIEKFKREGIYAEKANNDVLGGIRQVRTLLDSGKLLISSHCQNLINEFRSYCWDGSQKKEQPIKLNDHACFLAGTKIITDRGDKPIENINIGDMVLTKEGYYPVIDCGITNKNAEIIKVDFSNGISIEGTGNHPVWIEEKGYIPLDSLRYGDTITICTVKQSYLKELNLDDIQHLKRDRIDYIFARTLNILKTVLDIYIKKSGKIKKGRFQRDTISTTKIISRLTTTLQILNVFQGAIIYQNPLKNILLKMKRHVKNIWKELDHSQKNGIDQKKVENGIPNTENLHLPNVNQYSNSVIFAKTNLEILHEEAVLDSVRMLANQHGEENKESMIDQEPVLSAENCLQLTNMQKLKPVLENVVVFSKVRLEEKKTVYNLTVNTMHEYFANGILVSNCDATRYVCLALGSSTDTNRFLTYASAKVKV